VNSKGILAIPYRYSAALYPIAATAVAQTTLSSHDAVLGLDYAAAVPQSELVSIIAGARYVSFVPVW
jgi:hypothetical protein